MALEFLCSTEAQINAAMATAKRGLPRGKVLIQVGRPRRTNEQMQRAFAMADELARQAKFAGEWRTGDEYMTIFVAAVTGVRLLPGLDGGVVPSVRSTTRLTKQEASDVIEAMHAFGADNDVVFNDV